MSIHNKNKHHQVLDTDDKNGCVDKADLVWLKKAIEIRKGLDFDHNGLDKSDYYKLMQMAAVWSNSDINGDNKVNGLDRIILRELLNNLMGYDLNGDGVTNGADADEARNRFACDTNGDGVVTINDCMAYIKQLIYGIAEDLNGDGKSDINDLSYICDTLANVSKYDFDHDGAFTHADINKMIRDFEMLEAADVNGDGNVNHGDLESLTELLVNWQTYDLDKNGVLDQNDGQLFLIEFARTNAGDLNNDENVDELDVTYFYNVLYVLIISQQNKNEIVESNEPPVTYELTDSDEPVATDELSDTDEPADTYEVTDTDESASNNADTDTDGHVSAQDANELMERLAVQEQMQKDSQNGQFDPRQIHKEVREQSAQK